MALLACDHKGRWDVLLGEKEHWLYAAFHGALFMGYIECTK